MRIVPDVHPLLSTCAQHIEAKQDYATGATHWVNAMLSPKEDHALSL